MRRLLLSLAAVVCVSGCIGQPGFAQSAAPSGGVPQVAVGWSPLAPINGPLVVGGTQFPWRDRLERFVCTLGQTFTIYHGDSHNVTVKVNGASCDV
ncbi:MAG: hypothetical protein IT208_16320, partial [Chthonomonadales bacterium]|nr:hypothetical protein [Chthonomonadales bacterium]